MSLAAQKLLPKSIQFKGAPEYSGQELLAAAGLKEGDVLDSAEMGQHAQKLMDSGVFENLTYKFDGQELVFQLTPSTQLFSLRLGNLPLAQGSELDARLHGLFPLYHGKVPADGALLEGVRGALEEMLAEQGIKAAVAAMPFTDQKLARITAIDFTITTPAVEVGEVRLKGATAAPETAVQEILSKLSGSPYDTVGSPNQIDAHLGGYYRDQGFLEAAVHSTPQAAVVDATGAIRIPFLVSIASGAQYRITGVQLASGLAVTQADFDRQSHIHPGDIADGERIRRNWEFIARQYHNKGYMKAQVKTAPTFDREKGTVSYTVAVEPGPLYTMGKLTIQNSAEDLRAAMLAAWKLPAGAVFNEGAILSYYATGDANPALARTFASANCKYILTLNDETRTVDVALRVEKKN
jgi:outer membrane protein insertion porin family